MARRHELIGDVDEFLFVEFVFSGGRGGLSAAAARLESAIQLGVVCVARAACLIRCGATI